MSKLSIYCCIFLFLFAVQLQADNTYPVIIAKKIDYPGGKLLINQKKPNLFFFIKQVWLEGNENLIRWNGLEKKEIIGINLGLNKILDAYLDSNEILVIGNRNNQTLALLYSLDFDLINSIVVDSNFLQTYDYIKISKHQNYYLALIKSNLYKISFENKIPMYSIIATKVEDFTIADNKIYLIENHQSYIFLKELSFNGNEIKKMRLEGTELNRVASLGNYLTVKSTFEDINSTLFHLIDLAHFKLSFKKMFDINANLIDFCTENATPIIFYTQIQKNEIAVVKDFLLDQSNQPIIQTLPQNAYEPMILKCIEGKIYVLTRNSITQLNINNRLELFHTAQFGNKFDNNVEIFKFKHNLLLRNNFNSEVLILENNKFWLAYYIYHNLLRYIVPIILFAIAFVFFRLYNKQRKIFTELLNLPSANIFLILNSKGIVENISARARELFNIDSSVNFKVPLASLLKNKAFEPIINFYETSLRNPGYYNQKITIILNNEIREYLFSISPYYSVSGRFKGFLINAIDITEQLERKKMANWAQLAHDMQTNLLTIKLNAEQMDCVDNTDNYNRIQRILHQVNLLQKRVRDIVTIGRSTNLELVETNTYELMSESASEFDKTIFPQVDISVICEKIDLICDKPKMIRAIRNCIENGIKALADGKGKIILDAWTEGRMVCLSIKDNGKGMDDETRKKFLTPYFSTSRDGKGFGIGTIIIQQAVELHNGKIEVKSKINTGTEIILKIPKIKKNR